VNEVAMADLRIHKVGSRWQVSRNGHAYPLATAGTKQAAIAWARASIKRRAANEMLREAAQQMHDTAGVSVRNEGIRYQQGG
jgi:hypothetical protein